MADSNKTGLGCSVMIILSPFSTLLKAYVIMCLWKWFIMPLGVTNLLGWAHAYGISIIAELLTGTYNAHNVKKLIKDDSSIWWNVGDIVLKGFIIPLIMLAIGYICYLCM